MILLIKLQKLITYILLVSTYIVKYMNATIVLTHTFYFPEKKNKKNTSCSLEFPIFG